MKIFTRMNGFRWLLSVLVAGLMIGGGYFAVNRVQALTKTAATSTTATLSTVSIQAADLAQTAVSAAGNLTLVDERAVELPVAGVVKTVGVKVGDTVKAGDVLLKLETTDLERAVEQAQLNVNSAKIALAKLQTPATQSETDKAKAALIEAETNLADVKAGSTAAEIAAARSTLAASQASYAELQAGKTQAQLTQLVADLKKAEVALAEAQRAYDQVAWRNDVGMTSESAALQEATITYEAAKAAYAEATAPASAADLQTALSTIQSAQVKLDELLNAPTKAELATAQTQVVDAKAALTDLENGATAAEVQSAEVTLQQALTSLEAAYRNLAATTVTAPVGGVVMTVDAKVGVQSAANSVVVTLADPTQLELVINVAEADMPNVAVGQTAQIEIDALAGQTFTGTVEAKSPVNDSSSTSVVYPVTIRLTDQELTNVLPGMKAVATLVSQEPVAANSWLVPTNALQKSGATTTVTVVRNQTQLAVAVTTGKVQGEWTTVQSAELKADDKVVGSVTSKQSSSSNNGPGAGGPPAGAGLGGGPGQ